MSIQFEKYLSLGLIFTADLKHVILDTVDGKLDGFFIIEDDKDADQIKLSKVIHEQIDIKINPKDWRIVTTLQQFDKKWKMDVYSTFIDSPVPDSAPFESVNNLPEYCMPRIQWLVPLALDATVIGSGFNQTLIRI